MKPCVTTTLAIMALFCFSHSTLVVVNAVDQHQHAAELRRGGVGGRAGRRALKDKKDKKVKTTKPKKEASEKTPSTLPPAVDEPPAMDAAQGCLSKDAVDGVMKAFEGAVVAISDAYWCRGNSANETECGGPVADGPPPKAACDRAYKIAHSAIDGAYGYADSVLFKPTLTAEPYTYRTTRNGALSYFIGTVCLNLAGLESEQFPDGNGDGQMFLENGFAINAYKGSDGVQRTGWMDLEYDLNKFVYRINPEGGQNCETAVVQGKMCFVHATTALGQTCVDKTFCFNDLSGDGLSPVITTHHSSATIKEESSLVICQSSEGGAGKVPQCS